MGSDDVKRWSSDPHGYAPGDSLLQAKFGNTPTIPAARLNGASSAFDPHKAGVFNLVDLVNQTTVVVDPAALDRVALQQSASLSDDPAAAYTYAREASIAKADRSRSKVKSQTKGIEKKGKAMNPSQEDLERMLQRMLDERLSETGPLIRNMRDDEEDTHLALRRTHERSRTPLESSSKQLPAAIDPMRRLPEISGLFFLTDTPSRPTRRVLFQQGGTLLVQYHEVLVGEQFVTLVYDTRFEYGMQYCPELGATITIVFDNKKMLAQHCGVQFQLGVLDVIVLLRVPENLEEGV